MIMSLEVSDAVAARLNSSNDAASEALQILVCGLYRQGRLSASESMRSLNITSRIVFDTLVARLRAERDWPDAEVERELATIAQHNQR